MTDAVGSFLRHAAAAACLTLALAHVAAAQPAPPPLAEAPAGAQFMSRYDFHLSANALAIDDPRFTWDTHFGGDFDLLNYVHGRATFLADYQAMLGEEFRPFDPNQGNYTLEAATSARLPEVEVFVVLHHVSRHISDRPKPISIAWNVLQGRALKRFEIDGTVVDLRADLGKVVARAFVDYSWTADADLLVRRPISPRLGVFARAYGEIFGVHKSVNNRGAQAGGRIEAGVRLPGQGGAVELFAGFEQMVDADAMEQLKRRWAFAGFRLVTH
jgi:hypothetical protein